MQLLNFLLPIAIGLYMFLLGMGVPLPPKMFKGSKPVGVVGLIIVFVGAFLMTPSVPKPDASAAAKHVADKMKETVSLPGKEENGLTLLDITSRGSTLVYVFKISKPKDEATALAKKMTVEIGNNACKNRDYKTMLQNGVSIAMDYQDKKGALVGQSLIQPHNCRL